MKIPQGCLDCAFKEDCHVKKAVRLCYHGDLHSDNRVGSGARNIECVNRDWDTMVDIHGTPQG